MDYSVYTVLAVEQILQNVHGLLYTVFSEPSYGSSVKLILTEMTLALNSLLEVIYINDEKLCSSVVKLVTSLFFCSFFDFLIYLDKRLYDIIRRCFSQSVI